MGGGDEANLTVTREEAVVPVRRKLEEWGFEGDEARWEDFRRLARLTALRRGKDGTFYLSNWWRGPLLYALVSRLKPANVLEFGTGRGYGALCMAKASVEGKFECRVWTIDTNPVDQPVEWVIDEGQGPLVRFACVKEIWERHVPPEIRDRVFCLTGASGSVLRSWEPSGRPLVDFFYIDAGHDYWNVTRDFMASLGIAGPRAVLVFDDYGDRPGYGVKRLIDGCVKPRCAPGALQVIDTMAEQIRPGSDGRIEHKMVELDLGGIADPLHHFFTPGCLRFHGLMGPWIDRARAGTSFMRRIVGRLAGRRGR